jgi:hypothetical protein
MTKLVIDTEDCASVQWVTIADGSTGMLVKPDVARRQIAAEAPREPRGAGPTEPVVKAPALFPLGPGDGTTPGASTPVRPTRFHGTVTIDANRLGRGAGSRRLSL